MKKHFTKKQKKASRQRMTGNGGIARQPSNRARGRRARALGARSNRRSGGRGE